MLGLQIAIYEFKAEDKIAQDKDEGAKRSPPCILAAEHEIEDEESADGVVRGDDDDQEETTQALPNGRPFQYAWTPHVAEEPEITLLSFLLLAEGEGGDDAARGAVTLAATGSGAGASGWGGGDGIF